MKKLFSQFAVLKYGNYGLLLAGMFISFIGTQMQVVGISWHLYQLTKSAASLGLIGVAGVIPILFFSPFAGVLADALDRKKLLIINQIAFVIITSAFALISYLHAAHPWTIYLVLFLSSLIVAIDLPTRQTIIPSIVPRTHLVSAFSLFSITRQTAIILGPTLAGFLISLYNVPVVYFCNAISFFIFLLTLIFIDLPDKKTKTEIDFASVLEGINYIRKSPILYSTMILDFFANFFAASTVIFPIFATEILHTGAKGLGLLYAAPSVGSVLAGLTSGAFSQVEKKGGLLLSAVTLYGIATVGFGLSRLFIFSLFCLAFVGASDMISMIIRSSLTQTITPDHIRGRMNSINMMFFIGGPFLGEAEAGFAAAIFGASLSVVIGGLGAVLSVVGITLFIPQLRDYREKAR